MSNLQATEIESNKKSNFILYVHVLNLILLILNFSLNFIGSPVIKYVYLAQVVTIFIAILLFEFNDVLLEIITLFFIEGQGRNLWDYQSWSRIIFDLLVFYSIAKIFIKNKKIINKKLLPWPIYTAILLHFLWYIIELFNIYSVSMFGVIGASKIYIYPILFFLGIIQSNLDLRSKEFALVYRFFIFIILAEVALTYYQTQFKESHMILLSPYYIKAMKEGIFTGTHFRPFGTTALPGMISVYLYLTVGFLFLKSVDYKGNILKIVTYIGSSLVIVFCQVRSALVKYLLIIGVIQFGMMFFERFKPKTVLPVFIIAITLIIGGKTFLLDTDSTGDENIDHARSRMSTLTKIDALKGERINIDTFTKVVATKLYENPFGFGPGVTGAASSLIQDDLNHNPLFNKDQFWAYDSLYISLIIDMGFGAFFYIFLIFYIPIYLFRYLLVFYKIKDRESYITLLACSTTLFIILLGNWGAIGLTYNPESFVFWFLASVGLKIINNYRLGQNKNA